MGVHGFARTVARVIVSVCAWVFLHVPMKENSVGMSVSKGGVREHELGIECVFCVSVFVSTQKVRACVCAGAR